MNPGYVAVIIILVSIVFLNCWGRLPSVTITDDPAVQDKVDGKLRVPSYKQQKYYIYFTAASYCSNSSVSRWSCKYCKKTGKNVKVKAILTNSNTNTLALVTMDKTKKEIVLTFRGSYNAKNFLEDAVVTQTSIGGNVKVHDGFLLATNSLYDQVVPAIKKLLKNNKDITSLVITGHSLGAAMASITLYKFQTQKEFKQVKYSLYVYGQPRTGNKAFADYFDQQSIPVARVVANRDIVPHMCLSRLGYVHHQNEIFIEGKTNTICSKKVYEDKSCSNKFDPLYSTLDHVKYWDVDYTGCALANPVALLANFAT